VQNPRCQWVVLITMVQPSYETSRLTWTWDQGTT